MKMRKARRELILLSFILTSIAVTLEIVALGTEEWVVSDARFSMQTGTKPSSIKYGLFKGIFKYDLGGFPTAYEISMTCSVSDNICAFICGIDTTTRENVLDHLYNNEYIEFDTSCPSVAKYYNQNYNVRNLRNTNSVDPVFINSGMYISTSIFFILSIVFGLVSALLCLWNATTNPINTYLSIFGIHIYNVITVITITLSIIFWSIIFGGTLAKNVCIQLTISGDMTSDGYANLGYSYWINILALVLYIISDVILYVRNNLVNREPKQITMEEVQDPGLILF